MSKLYVLRIAVAICLIFVSIPSSFAWRLDPDQFSGPMREYQIELAKIILVRARNTGYRSQFSGMTTVMFTINRSGIIEEFHIKESSGSPYIDSLAKEILRVGARYIPFPEGAPMSHMVITVPIRFVRHPR
ncbi:MULTISPECIES: TonB family protein [Methylobacterium]|uniref:TonB C-terminal domain-containing protein n=1 Tax=Methylobacterium bullatum TaxID=570505 RepID=A0AAV4ZAJ7_9HYPH|nr:MULTISPECIES: TonB family protein [Methylobacterium]KQO54743.1 hypothetical protein ASF08_01345 [Methylobacterium sp. Leaf85]MBD8901725.1 hypothetical protein [Methylobacterium bullatum]TXN26421.1 TonB family protein [Methylobacterium sp. WL19]GJD41073.1 hypothetical protein OICFNHDK_3551 [Methylobacterium bullatum]